MNLFKISSNTIGRWLKEYKENGGFVEKKRKIHEARKIDPETLKAEIEKNPGTTIVMDNASFHKSSKTKELIEKAGCNLLYLAPYLSDYNPLKINGLF